MVKNYLLLVAGMLLPYRLKPTCENGSNSPQFTKASCPTCGTSIGTGAHFDVSGPCYNASWDKSCEYIVLKGVRVDRNGALCPQDYKGTICDRCSADRRQAVDVWTGSDRRRKK